MLQVQHLKKIDTRKLWSQDHKLSSCYSKGRTRKFEKEKLITEVCNYLLKYFQILPPNNLEKHASIMILPI